MYGWQEMCLGINGCVGNVFIQTTVLLFKSWILPLGRGVENILKIQCKVSIINGNTLPEGNETAITIRYQIRLPVVTSSKFEGHCFSKYDGMKATASANMMAWRPLLQQIWWHEGHCFSKYDGMKATASANMMAWRPLLQQIWWHEGHCFSKYDGMKVTASANMMAWRPLLQQIWWHEGHCFSKYDWLKPNSYY